MKKETKVIAMLNFKGGVGKTLHATLLQKSLDNSLVLNLDNQNSEKNSVAETINGLDVMESENIEIEDLVDALCEDLKYLIIDTPGQLESELLNVLDKIDCFIVPYQQDVDVIDYTIDTVATIFDDDFMDTGKKKKVIFLLNQATTKKHIDFHVNYLKDKLSKNEELMGKIDESFETFARSEAVVTMKQRKESLTDLSGSNKVAYGVVNKRLKALHKNVIKTLKNK